MRPSQDHLHPPIPSGPRGDLHSPLGGTKTQEVPVLPQPIWLGQGGYPKEEAGP